MGALTQTSQILTVQTHSPKLTSFLLKPADAILFPGSPVSCLRAPLWSRGKRVCWDTAATGYKGQGDECRKSKKHSMPIVSISSESRLSWPKYTRNHPYLAGLYLSCSWILQLPFSIKALRGNAWLQQHQQGGISPWHSSCVVGHKNEPTPIWWATKACYLLQPGSHRLHTAPEPAEALLLLLWGKARKGSGFLSPQVASLSHWVQVRFAGRGVQCLGCCWRCSSDKKHTAPTSSCYSRTSATSPSKDTNNLDGSGF